MALNVMWATIGVTIEKKPLVVGGQDVTLMLWDLAGAEGPFGVPASYVRGAAGFVLVADGTRPETLDVGRDLRRDLRSALGGVPGVLVLNKHDLADAWRLRDLGADDEGDPILLTSAKTGDGVDTMFLRLAERMLRQASS